MDSEEIKEMLKRLGGYHSIFIPEFTFSGLRIDAVVIDLSSRWIRGFEIKIDRGDFLKDTKWTLYSRFCSSLSIVCPRGLIKKEEVEKPFGLLWVGNPNNYKEKALEWVKRPKNFQKRNSLAWLWTYISVLEQEFPRMNDELIRLQRDLNYLRERMKELKNV